MANEKRLDLIDRSELLPNGIFYVNCENPMTSLDELLDRIVNAKSVDAVEVVRCKDCKECFTRANGTTYCRRTGRYAATDDFCSYGERREGE